MEAPGTAPGSAIYTHCAVYRHSWQASVLYIGINRHKEKAFRGNGVKKLDCGMKRFLLILFGVLAESACRLSNCQR